jgi:LmbE family N-acetylglucosaminyl deacetylase
MDSLHGGRFTVRASLGNVNLQAQEWQFWEPDMRERIMILAPHPDDEVLASGGMIATALNSSHPPEIRVIVVTNGDASYATALFHSPHLTTQKNFQHQTVLRQQESLSALAILGLDEKHVHFWGFPDRGVAALWKNHWDAQHPYRSYTTGFDKSLQALNSPIVPFTGEGFMELFGKELLEFFPTTIILPHPQDHHPDHNALARFTLRAVKQYYLLKHLSPPALFAYWMWKDTKPWLMNTRPRSLAEYPVDGNLSYKENIYFKLRSDIQEQKAKALQCYPSQKVSAGKLFREASIRNYEAFTLLYLAL